MHRRIFLRSGLAAAAGGAALGALGSRAVAAVTLGDGRLSTVSDGHLVLPDGFVIGDLPEAEARALVESAGYSLGGLRSPCNLALWEAGDRKVLIDAGAGWDFMPSTGQIVDNLAALGVAPDEITDVVFTHGHPDHLWGATDDFDEPLFLNAAHYMGDAEYAYWSDPATVDDLPPDRQSFAAGALRRLDLLGPGMAQFGAGDEVVPGLTAVPTPGHTPGHMSLRVAAGGDSALILGDAINNGHLALMRPEWPSPADQDPETGIATRMALLEELSASGETVVGFHLPDGGIGRLAREGAAFTFSAM